MSNLIQPVATAVIALAALAAAQNASPIEVPANSQIGLIHFPVSCSVLGLVPVTLDAVFSATGAVYGQPGQAYYLSDAVATLTIPHSITSLVGLLGGTQADTLAFVTLETSNASPATLPLFDDGLWVNGTHFNTTGDTTLRVPSEGQLPPVGPLYLGDVGKPVELQFGTINATIYVQNAEGKQILPGLPISCPLQDPSVVLLVAGVEPATVESPAPLAPSLGYTPNYPPQSTGSEYGFYNFELECATESHGTFEFALTPGGALQSITKPGEEFSLTDVTAYLSAGQSAIKSFRHIFPGLDTIDVTVNSFYISSTSASPAAINGIADPVAKHLKVPTSGNLTVDIPPNAPAQTLNVGPFTASYELGTEAALIFTNASASFVAYNAAGKTLGNLAFDCTPKYFTELITVLITEKEFPKYTS